MTDLSGFRDLLSSSNPADRIKAIGMHYDFPAMAVNHDDIVHLLQDPDPGVRSVTLDAMLVREFPFNDADLAARLLQDETHDGCRDKLAKLFTWYFYHEFGRYPNLSRICLSVFESKESEGDWVFLTKFILVAETVPRMWKTVFRVLEHMSEYNNFEQRQSAQAALRFIAWKYPSRSFWQRRRIKSLIDQMAERGQYCEIGRCAREIQKKM